MTGPPPYYEATRDIYVGNPESGVMPVAAYRTGDRVDPDTVTVNGWQDMVRVPDVFAPPPAEEEVPAAPPKDKAGKPPAPEPPEPEPAPDNPAAQRTAGEE